MMNENNKSFGGNMILNFEFTISFSILILLVSPTQVQYVERTNILYDV